MNNVSKRIVLALIFGCFLLCPCLWGFSLLSLRNLCFFLCLLEIAVSDFFEYKISNKMILAGISIWAISCLCFIFFKAFLEMPCDKIFSENILAHIKDGVLAALIFAFGIYFLSVFLRVLLRKKVLGGGDIKLFFVTGLYLGITKSLYMIFLACALGLIFSLILGRKKKIPFGPSIALATVVVVSCC